MCPMRVAAFQAVLTGMVLAFAVACADAPASFDVGPLALDRDVSPGTRRDGGAGDTFPDSPEWSDVSDWSDGALDTGPETEDGGLAQDSGTAEDSGPADSGAPDAGEGDSGGTSDASADAAVADSGGGDESAPEAGTPDAGMPDSGGSDAGMPDAGSALDEDPIVFVHGWLWNAKDWQDFIDYFTGVGYPEEYLVAIQYSDTAGSNVKNARDELPPFVDAVLQKTGRQRVDIVGHSMAGLSVRLYILKFGGKDRVRDVFLLAPTNHGGTEACLVTWMGDGAREMCPDYAPQDKSVNAVQWDLNGDPDSEDVDETPFCVEHGTGELFFTTIRDGKDTFAVPHHTACLNQKSKGDCSHAINLDPGFDLGHFGLLHDQRVFQIVEQKLRAHNPGRPR
jgi:pimeloyl-ACP methyl ester carboxylesterase